jgi:hypothetical protein
MSSDSLSNEIRDDDVDLLELFRRIGRTFSKWFRVAGRALLIVIVFFARNIIPLIFSVIIGIGLSYLMKWRSKPVYHSQIVLRNNVVPNSDMIDYFDKLSFLISERNISTVSSALSISPEKASVIKEMNTYWVIDINKDEIPDYIDYKKRFDPHDTVNARMLDRLVINIAVTDPEILPDISDGFNTYAKQNTAFLQMNEFRLKKNVELLDRITYDIKQLDSLQKVKYFEETRNRTPEKGGQMIFLQEQKTQLVYDDIYRLYEKKQFQEKEIELYPEILTVLNNFYEPVNRDNGVFYYGEFIIPCTFGLMIIYLVISRNRKRLREIYKKY